MKYCTHCGNALHDQAVLCVKCGCPVTAAGQTMAADPNKSEKTGVTTLLLAIFLGCLGVHRFYVGKVGTGLLMLFTWGGFGIWYLIDIILIVTESFTDNQGKVVKL